jgi:hypothetical protein
MTLDGYHLTVEDYVDLRALMQAMYDYMKPARVPPAIVIAALGAMALSVSRQRDIPRQRIFDWLSQAYDQAVLEFPPEPS